MTRYDKHNLNFGLEPYDFLFFKKFLGKIAKKQSEGVRFY